MSSIENFPVWGRFSKKPQNFHWNFKRIATLGRHNCSLHVSRYCCISCMRHNTRRCFGYRNSVMITDCRKFITKITLYRISSFHFRSTLQQTRPNKAGLKYPSIRPHARRYTVWPDPRSRSRSWAFQSWKSIRFQKLSPLPFTMGAGNWPWILKQGHNIYLDIGQISKIWPHQI